MAKTVKFVDRVKIYVQAGNGGNGSASFRREKFVPRGGPDGGDGGSGGDVLVRADANANSLLDLYYSPHQRAGHGEAGRSQKRHGKNGENRVIPVPCGTVVLDEETGDPLGEVLEEEQTLLLAAGGRGGLGNCHFVSSVNRAPRKCTPGKEGEQKTLRLELKIVADVGLVGYPNAGKSTLIRHLSAAHPKVAAYPFTTLQPVIGILECEDFRTLRIADIPGLIDGAHEGVGLGHDFLRHIERCPFLLFIVDMAGVDGRHPADDFQNLRAELAQYRADLAERPYQVIANKMDLPEAKDFLIEFEDRTGEKTLRISAEKGDNIAEIKDFLHKRFYG